MHRQQRSDIERLHAVVGAEDVMYDEHLELVQDPDPDRLAGAVGERVRPVQRARAKLVAVEVGRPDVQQRGADPVLPGLGVLLDEALVHQRAQQSVHGALREPELPGDLDHAQLAAAAREQAQDRGCAFDRLDVSGHD